MNSPHFVIQGPPFASFAHQAGQMMDDWWSRFNAEHPNRTPHRWEYRTGLFKRNGTLDHLIAYCQREDILWHYSRIHDGVIRDRYEFTATCDDEEAAGIQLIIGPTP